MKKMTEYKNDRANVRTLTTHCPYLMNSQLTKPAHVNGPFVIVMERRPGASPKRNGSKSIITTHNPNASREAAASWKPKEKHMNDCIRCSPKSQNVSKVMITIKSGLKSQNALFKLNSHVFLTPQGCRREVVAASPRFNNLKGRHSSRKSVFHKVCFTR